MRQRPNILGLQRTISAFHLFVAVVFVAGGFLSSFSIHHLIVSHILKMKNEIFCTTREMLPIIRKV